MQPHTTCAGENYEKGGQGVEWDEERTVGVKSWGGGGGGGGENVGTDKIAYLDD